MLARCCDGAAPRGEPKKMTPRIFYLRTAPHPLLPPIPTAEVAELADAQESGSCGRDTVGVQVPPSAPSGGYPVNGYPLFSMMRAIFQDVRRAHRSRQIPFHLWLTRVRGPVHRFIAIAPGRLENGCCNGRQHKQVSRFCRTYTHRSAFGMPHAGAPHCYCARRAFHCKIVNVFEASEASLSWLTR